MHLKCLAECQACNKHPVNERCYDSNANGHDDITRMWLILLSFLSGMQVTRCDITFTCNVR